MIYIVVKHQDLQVVGIVIVVVTLIHYRCNHQDLHVTVQTADIWIHLQ